MSNNINKYYIDMIFDLEKEIVDLDVSLNYFSISKNTKKLNFYIHKDFKIVQIKSDNLISYEVSNEISNWNPFICESKLISLYFNDALSENECIKFKYKCTKNFITSNKINRITNNWIELGMYSPWFPLSENIEPALFNIKININSYYTVINSNKIDNYLILNQLAPSNDCTIIASNDFKCIEQNSGENTIKVYYVNKKQKNVANKISTYSISILNHFKKFGDIEFKDFSIVISPRKENGGYCRPNLIVLASDERLNNHYDYYSILAHELAHLWWSKAESNTWEDWLNESFAEFSSLLAIKNEFGDKQFTHKINQYIKASNNLPAIINLNRNSDNAYTVLYIKGPILLYKLYLTIGENKFYELLNIMYSNNIKTTEMFLYELEKLTNKNIRIKFQMLLNS